MGARERMSPEDGHILIGGTGRAGTTLLVQWFTAMNFDTGFTLEEALTRTDPISHGGLEHSLSRTLAAGARLPHVAKSPWFGPKLAAYIDREELRIEAVVVPLRELADAAESRRQVSRRAEAAGYDPHKHPGGVLGAGQAGERANRKQEQQLARRFYDLIVTLVRYDVPIYFLRFPDFARGAQDPSQVLEPLLAKHGLSQAEATAALQRVVRPELIHDFREPG